MNFQFLITFGISLGLYFIGLLIFVLIKKHINKKKFEKEQKERLEGNENVDTKEEIK